jgi:ssDNA-binding replication factor A large subunit
MPTSAPPKTFISDLRPGRLATIEATATKLEAVREIEQRMGGKKKVRDGVLKDGTGEIALVLWGDEVGLVAEGDAVRVVDGWVKEYKGRSQITLGRTGRLEKQQSVREDPNANPGST